MFENVLLPVGKEYGLSATYEEYKEYIGSFAGTSDSELSEDELTQIAGGKGDGVVACPIIGADFGRLQTIKAKSRCFVLGVGVGICVYEGISDE